MFRKQRLKSNRPKIVNQAGLRMTNYHVRSFAAKDAENVVALHWKSFPKDAPIPPGEFDDLKNIHELFLIDGAFVVAESVASPTNELVGMGGIKRVSPNRGEVMRMAVHPDWQRKGIAKSILAKLESEAGSLGFNELVLHTLADFDHAVKFYKNCGYNLVGKDVMYGNQVLGFQKRLP